MRLTRNLIIFSLVIGLILTFLSAFSINTYVIGEFPNIRFVSIPILGVKYSGHPMPWTRQVVYPGAQIEIIMSHLIIDLIFWVGMIVLLKTFYDGSVKSRKSRRKKPKRKTKQNAKRRTKRKPKRKAKKRITKRKPKRKTTRKTKRRTRRRWLIIVYFAIVFF